MDKFYDVNDFIVYLFRKWKTLFAVIILAAVIFAGNRGISLYQDYRTQPASGNQSAEAVSNDDEPMWVSVQCVLQIDAQDMTEEVIEAYARLCGSDQLMSSMYEKWYAAEKEEYSRRVTKLHDYGYILDKEVNYPYAAKDFYSQFLINSTDINSSMKTRESYDENFVLLGFKSTNQEIATEVAQSYASELTELVRSVVGDFSYETQGQTIWYELPYASSGTQASRTVSSVTSSNITMKQVILQTVKGLVWGAVIGVVLSVILVFFMYMMTRRANLLSDMKQYGLPVLGAGFIGKTHFRKIRAAYHTALEGGNWDSTGCRNISERIAGLTELEYGSDSIIVTGTCSSGYIKAFVQALNKAAGKDRFIFARGMNSSFQDFAEFGGKKMHVLVVEKMGESLKDNIDYEIKKLQEYKADVLGFVIFE